MRSLLSPKAYGALADTISIPPCPPVPPTNIPKVRGCRNTKPYTSTGNVAIAKYFSSQVELSHDLKLTVSRTVLLELTCVLW